MNKFLTLLVIVVPLLFAMQAHPVYVSNTEIDYKKKDKRLEIAVKIFSDDLEDAISEIKGTTVEIGTDREHEKATEYIIEYFQKHFELTINSKKVPFEYVTRKLVRKDFFATWVLLKVEKVKNLKSLKLRNNLLIDYHSEQQNIINYREDDGTYKKFATYKEFTEVDLK